jgi:GST-like protein
VLTERPYVAGGEYSIADIAIFPWYGALVLGELYNAAEFLAVAEYKNVLRWARQMAGRPAVRRGRLINRSKEADAVRERH